MKGYNFVLSKRHIAIIDYLYKKKGFQNRSQLIRDLIELEYRIDKREEITQKKIQQHKKSNGNTQKTNEGNENNTKNKANCTKNAIEKKGREETNASQ
jgi:Arc/MetJ-type ribon-helix-helix transcriptional regulator